MISMYPSLGWTVPSTRLAQVQVKQKEGYPAEAYSTFMVIQKNSSGVS
jgi:hypothetical protein